MKYRVDVRPYVAKSLWKRERVRFEWRATPEYHVSAAVNFADMRPRPLEWIQTDGKEVFDDVLGASLHARRCIHQWEEDRKSPQELPTTWTFVVDA